MLEGVSSELFISLVKELINSLEMLESVSSELFISQVKEFINSLESNK